MGRLQTVELLDWTLKTRKCVCVCVCSKNWHAVASNQIFWIWRSSQCFWFWVLVFVLLPSSIQPVNLMLVAFCLAGASGVTTDLFAASRWRFARLFNEVRRVYMEFVLFIRSFWTQLRRAWWKRNIASSVQKFSICKGTHKKTGARRAKSFQFELCGSFVRHASSRSSFGFWSHNVGGHLF